MVFSCRVQGIWCDILEKCCVNCWGIWDIIPVLLGIRGWTRPVFLNVFWESCKRSTVFSNLRKSRAKPNERSFFIAELLTLLNMQMCIVNDQRSWSQGCTHGISSHPTLRASSSQGSEVCSVSSSLKTYFASSFSPLLFCLWKWLRV